MLVETRKQRSSSIPGERLRSDPTAIAYHKWHGNMVKFCQPDHLCSIDGVSVEKAVKIADEQDAI
jgi:hypothetical protein